MRSLLATASWNEMCQFFIRWGLGVLLTALVATSHSATQWQGGLKVVAIHTDLAGNVFVQFDQNFTISTGCPHQTIAVIPKAIPSSPLTLNSDAAISRSLATTQLAFAASHTVVVGIENTFGCLFGVYPTIVQIGLYK